MKKDKQPNSFIKIFSKFIFWFIGLGALIWFLIRVIPKPSRAAYPCQKAAFPIASAFVIYIVSLVSSSFAFLKFKEHSRAGHNLAASVFLIFIIVSCFFVLQSDKPYSYANFRTVVEDPNQPIGIGKGIFPGRVVWVRDSTAVDQDCTNSSGDYWWMDSNTDQAKVSEMLSKALEALTGKSSVAEAWDAVFRYYNQSHDRGDVGYSSGEKIVIKLNLNTGCTGTNNNRSDLSLVDTSPQIVYAVLDQLVNIVGVPQEDIGFGDPGRNVDNIFWNKFHSTFPQVKYWGNGTGRTPVELSDNPELHTSDGEMDLYLPKCYLEAAYMINIPVFKQHHRGGVSLTSKNHFGTFVLSLGNAFPLHYSLPCTEGDGNVNNGEYHSYRIFTDFIGHKDLGGKTILYLIDGLWSSTNWGDPPWKWKTAPFNNSYPASIFASLDPVAIESVGFDFLFNEFYPGNPSGNAFPHYDGVDDFLHQAADSVNWPEGILYDPEADGSYLPRSMGVHEHWNNGLEKKYTRNLGTGDGIELVQVSGTTDVKEISKQPVIFRLENNFPNPFNPSTKFRYSIPEGKNVSIIIFDINGKKIKELMNGYQKSGVYEVTWNGTDDLGRPVSSGPYIYTVNAGGFKQCKKMVLIK
ncbi:MAG TPA: DUF362 domain-containing protein [Ignavibacteriaceae bacterium]|nr:DUF362 domain-containing protein [Ignavibacteriaceae bacterium]